MILGRKLSGKKKHSILFQIWAFFYFLFLSSPISLRIEAMGLAKGYADDNEIDERIAVECEISS